MNTPHVRPGSSASVRHGWFARRRRMPLIVVAACVLVAWGAALAAGPRQATVPDWRERLDSWLSAVADHQPGLSDASAFFMSGWFQGDLEAAATDLVVLTSLYARISGSQVVRYRNYPFSADELRKLLRLQKDELGQRGTNLVLMRAAVLHADVAMRVLPVLGADAGCSATRTITAADGNRIGSGCVIFHWKVARTLLDQVYREPDVNPTAALWYHATSAFLLEHTDYANAAPHLDWAQPMFPHNPAILFEHGWLHEAQASPDIQGAVHGLKTSVQPADTNLKEARDHYRSALQAEKDFVEARVHYGRVLGALGRHDEAAVELSKAVQQATATRLRYYAELFLGDELRALNNRDGARDHYRRAADLVPQAQSPRLALGFLARQSGDRAGSVQAIQQVLSQPVGDYIKLDPWWTYYQWQNRGSDELLRQLYRDVQSEGRR